MTLLLPSSASTRLNVASNRATATAASLITRFLLVKSRLTALRRVPIFLANSWLVRNLAPAEEAL